VSGHKIIGGLEDAIAFAQGDTSRGRLETYRVHPLPAASRFAAAVSKIGGDWEDVLVLVRRPT